MGGDRSVVQGPFSDIQIPFRFPEVGAYPSSNGIIEGAYVSISDTLRKIVKLAILLDNVFHSRMRVGGFNMLECLYKVRTNSEPLLYISCRVTIISCL